MRASARIIIGIILLIICQVSAYSQNCTVNAGYNYSICSGDNFSLDGSAGGALQAGSIHWSVISQPSGASVSISNPSSLFTTAGSATVSGTYVFRLAVTCSDAISIHDDVIVTVYGMPTTPAISGTTTFSCYTGAAVTVTGTAPASGETVRWTVATGQGSFASATSNTTTFTPSFPVDECATTTPVIIRYSIRNSNGCERSVTRTLSFARSYPLSASAATPVVCGTSTTLKGNCPGSGTSAWSLVSKPTGTPDPVFSQPTNKLTTVSGLQAGNYVFRYTVTGGCNPGSVNVSISVAGTAAVSSSNAGKDQHFCTMPAQAVLTGSTPAVGETVSWTQIGGASATIANSTAANTMVSGLTDAGAPYTFVYRINNGSCSNTDTVSLYKIPDLSFTTTDGSYCSSTLGSTSTGIFTFGNYAYQTLDSVGISITYLSGPISSSIGVTVRRGNNLGASPLSSQNFTSIGQTRTWQITGDNLYFPATDPASRTYYLDNTFALGANIGIHRFRISYTTRCRTYETEFTVYRGISGGGLNAGTDANVPCNTTSFAFAGNVADNLGMWTTISMPAGATDPINSSNQNLRNPTINGLIPGTYIFRYGRNTGPACVPTAYDDVTVTVANSVPPTPNAGADRTTCAGTVQLTGSAIPAGALANWTLVSPASPGVTIADPETAAPFVSGLAINTTYTFRYTLSNGCGTAFDDVVITTGSGISPERPVISSTVANCGINAGAVPLSFGIYVNHPAFTPGGGIDSTWRVITYPASLQYILTPATGNRMHVSVRNITETTAISIIYGLRNPACPDAQLTDTLTILYRASTEPAINAGELQQLCSVSAYPYTAVLSGSTTTVPVLWTPIYASGLPATIVNPTSSTTNVILPQAGVYRFMYQYQSPTDAACTFGQHITQITTSGAVSPAFAGNDIEFCNASGITALGATPAATGTGLWQVHSVLGGAAPTIASPTSPTSNVTFSQSGSVILRWNTFGTVAECGPASSDLVTVTYYAPAQAGNNQELCGATSTSLNALNPAPGTGVWSQIAGSPATIGNTASAQTTVQGLTAGTYRFRWSVTTPGACSSFDDVDIVVSSVTTPAEAGPNVTSCSGGDNTISLNASAAPTGYTGTWALFSKPTAAPVGSFSNINQPGSLYTGVTVPGKYIFAWTISNGACSSTDYVEIDANGATTCAILTQAPIQLITETDEKNCAVTLKWQTGAQTVDGFEIERSEDGTAFETISTKFSSSKKEYSYKDNNTTTAHYFYRIKQTGAGGNITYSWVSKASLQCLSNTTTVSVYPNPVLSTQRFTVKINTNTVNTGIIDIRNVNGQKIHSYPVVLKKGLNLIPYPVIKLSAGLYIIQLTGNDNSVTSVKLIVK